MASGLKTMTMSSTIAEDLKRVAERSAKYANELGTTTKLAAMKTILDDYHIQTFVNRYTWKGLPKEIPYWRMEQILYFRGSLLFFKERGSYYALPYAPTAGINAYGLYTEAVAYPFNGSFVTEDEVAKYKRQTLYKPVKIMNFLEKTPDAEGVILYDRFGIQQSSGILGRWYMDYEIAKEVADRLGYLKITLLNSQGKVIIVVNDENQRKVTEDMLNSIYGSPKNVQVLVNEGLDVQFLQPQMEYQEQKIWEDIASWMSLRSKSVGYSNTGVFNKKERMTTSESESNNAETTAILDNGLQARKLFCEQLKVLFEIEADVEINESLTNQQESLQTDPTIDNIVSDNLN